MQPEVRTPEGFPLPQGIVVKWEELAYIPELAAWRYSLRATDVALPEEFWGRCACNGISVVGGTMVEGKSSVVTFVDPGDIREEPRYIAFRSWGAMVPVDRKDDMVDAIRRGAIPRRDEGAPFEVIPEKVPDPQEEHRKESRREKARPSDEDAGKRNKTYKR